MTQNAKKPKQSYRQGKRDICEFCGDILGLGPKLIIDRITNYFPFECQTAELIACTGCKTQLGRKQIVGKVKCAEFLDKGYSADLESKMSAIDWSDAEIARVGYNIQTLVEPNRRLAEILAGKLRHLGIVSIGQKAVSIRNLRVNFEQIRNAY
jgi:hypothetical protein